MFLVFQRTSKKGEEKCSFDSFATSKSEINARREMSPLQ